MARNFLFFLKLLFRPPGRKSRVVGVCDHPPPAAKEDPATLKKKTKAKKTAKKASGASGGQRSCPNHSPPLLQRSGADQNALYFQRLIVRWSF